MLNLVELGIVILNLGIIFFDYRLISNELKHFVLNGIIFLISIIYWLTPNKNIVNKLSSYIYRKKFENSNPDYTKTIDFYTA